MSVLLTSGGFLFLSCLLGSVQAVKSLSRFYLLFHPLASTNLAESTRCVGGGQHYSENFHLVIGGKTFNFDDLALLLLCFAPTQTIRALLRFCSTRITHLAIIFEWTIVDFAKLFDLEHDFLGGISGIHQQCVINRKCVLSEYNGWLGRPHLGCRLCFFCCRKVYISSSSAVCGFLGISTGGGLLV